MRTERIGLVFGILCFATASLAAAGPVTVLHGDVRLADSVQVLQLGNLAPKVAAAASLEIRPTLPQTQVRVYCDGPYLSCRWSDREERTDRPSPGGTLELLFEATEAVPEPHSLIITDQRGKPQVLVVVDFLLFESAQAAQKFETPDLASGLGKDWGEWYDVCSGPAPPGYTLASEDFEIDGSNRGCHTFGECDRRRRDDQNVCWEFRLQGKEARFPDAAEIVKAQGKLRVAWTLIRTPPRLEPVPQPTE